MEGKTSRSPTTQRHSWRCTAATALFLLVAVVAIFGALIGVDHLRSANPEWSGWKTIDGAIIIFFLFLGVSGVYAVILKPRNR